MKQESCQKKVVKIFLNKWENTANSYWNQVETKLKDKGYDVFRESSECDWAILMNATFMNPSTYKNKVGFYIGAMTSISEDEKKVYWLDLMAPILEKYYKPGHLLNINGSTIDQAVSKVIYVYEQLANDNQNN